MLITARAAEPVSSFFDPDAGRPPIRVFAPTEYGAHHQVWTMTEDAAGIVYVGAYGGLLEFDGSAWRLLPFATGSIRDLKFTPDGRLWAISNDDFGWCERDATGAMRYHSVRAALPPESLPIGALPDMAVVGSDVWLVTMKGLVRWRDGQARFWPKAQGPVWKFYPHGDKLWLRQTGETSLAELRGEEWVTVFDDPALSKKPLNFILPAADGSLIFGINLGGLWRVVDGKLARWETPASTVLSQARLYAGRMLRDGSLAVGTLNEGLFLISPDGRAARQLRMPDGLPSNLISGLGTDRSGRLWVCTYHGLARLDWPTPITLFDSRAQFDPATTQSIVRRDGAMMLGGYGGTHRLKPATPDSLAPPILERVGGSLLITGPAIPHRGGAIYASAGGIKFLEGGGETYAVKLEDNLTEIALTRVDPDRVLHSGQNGLGSARYVDGQWRHEGYAPNLKQAFSTVSAEADGGAWAVSMSEQYYYLPPMPAGPVDWSKVEIIPGESFAGWPTDAKTTLHSTGAPFGRVFFAGAQAIRLDFAQRRFVPDRRLDLTGMPRGEVWPSESGQELWCNVWLESPPVGGRNALGRFVFDGDKPARWQELPAGYSPMIGSLGFTRFFSDPGQSGVVWFVGTNAVARLVVAAMPSNSELRAPVIRRVQAGDRALPLAESGVRVPFSAATIAIEFSAPGAVQTRFRTRLLGWNENWSKGTARSVAEFTGLAPGRYTFEVCTEATNGEIGPTASYRFRIMPPGWLSPWAFAVYGLAGMGGIFGFVRWRLARAGRDRRRLEALVAERTRDLAAARDQAETASRAKSAFLASMSHELRTPLNGVIGYAQVLQNDRRLFPDQQERLRIVRSSGEHLLRMINDVLDLAKIEAGKLELRVAAFALEDLLRDVVAAHTPAASGKNLALHFELAPGLPAWVKGDAQKLRQVLDNLLGNAVKFTARGGVTLRVDRAASDASAGTQAPLRFAVVDTGPGIADDDRARLFEPFEQANLTRPAAPGTGLGLAISRALVERMGGTLALASTPGAGSTFSFSVPLPSAAVLAPAAIERDPLRITGHRGPARRIAIVDDHPVNRSLLEDLLRPLGFGCDAFESGRAILDALAGGRTPWPDLAIVDVRMDGMDGLELTRQLRTLAAGRPLRVLLTSASVLTFDPAEGRAAGCDDFLPKPFRTTDLIDRIGRLLELQWLETPKPFPDPTLAAAGANGHAALPASVRAALIDALELGDLDAVRRLIVTERTGHPEAESEFQALDDAAAAFQLSRLRQLLQRP